MSQLKVNAIRHTGASSDAITLASDGKATYAATSGTSNFTISDGDLVIGTSGHGIDFSATANSSGANINELLDDYEEGTFTPTLSYWNGSSGVTYLAQEGEYTKIGNAVFFKFRVNLTSKGSSSGNNVIFEGFPFAASLSSVANPMFQFNAVAGMNLGSDSKNPWCQFNTSTKMVVYMFDYGGNGDYEDVLGNHIDDDAQFAVTGHYYT